MNNLAGQISGAVKLRDVMEFYGIPFNARGFAICPFHAEKTASLSIKNGHYKCFGCGAYGDVIDFVMEYHGLKFTQALVKLDNDFHLGLAGRKPTYRERAQETENRRLGDAEAHFKAELWQMHETLTDVRRCLYARLMDSGEEWVKDMVEKLDMILDNPDIEEVMAWEMMIRA